MNTIVGIGPDGTVLAATGEQLSKLVDRRLEECEALPREIREAGTALTGRLRDSGSRVLAQTIAPSRGGSLQLVAIEAVAVRCAATDLRALLSSKLSVISSQAASLDVTLSVEVADEVPAVVRLDSEKVAWAVTTLVGNALRYLRAGSRRKPGAIGVKATYDPAVAEVTVEVKDNGPGIPADTVSRLFARDGLDVRGAGLALLLLADVMAAHGGRVAVSSSTDPVGHGTTIRLMFPAR